MQSLAKIALSTIVGVLVLANAMVAWVLVRMSGSSSEQLANIGGRLTGTLVLATLVALLSYKVIGGGAELRFMKALALGLVVWLGANSAQFKQVSARQQARLSQVFMDGCRKRCLEKTRQAPGVTAQEARAYCEDYCDCLKEPALAMMDRYSKGPDAKKRMAAEIPAALSAPAEKCDQRAAAKAGLTPSAAVPITDPRHPDHWKPGWE